MKIMSFNTQHCLNFLEQRIDFARMANTIKQYDADIVGLNEMRDKGESPDFDRQTAILSELTGIEHFFFAKAIDVKGKNPYGNALLSKLPIEHAEVIPIPDPAVRNGRFSYETRCLLKARLAGGITVLVTHFGLNLEEQENAVRTVVEHLEPENCVLMGDFNVTPDDSVLAPIRARMRDAAEAFAAPLLSYPSNAPERKIDYIFVSRDIEIVSADIPAVVASDHRPHLATVKL